MYQRPPNRPQHPSKEAGYIDSLTTAAYLVQGGLPYKIARLPGSNRFYFKFDPDREFTTMLENLGRDHGLLAFIRIFHRVKKELKIAQDLQDETFTQEMQNERREDKSRV